MRALFVCLCTVWASFAGAQTRVEVDVELFLAVDISRSMQPFELEIQRRGYAAALTSDAVLGAVSGGMLGRIAVTYVEWAGARTQRVVVPWTLLATPADAERVAAQILAHDGEAARRTSVSGALAYGTAALAENAFDGLRRVIDISGDGPNNMGLPVTQARDAALAQGITINGLPLMTESGDITSMWNIPDLDAYYDACVIGGPGAFLVPVTEWSAFAEAVRRKLVLEIAARPAQTGGARLWRAQADAPYNCLVGEQIWARNRDIFALP